MLMRMRVCLNFTFEKKVIVICVTNYVGVFYYSKTDFECTKPQSLNKLRRGHHSQCPAG